MNLLVTTTNKYINIINQIKIKHILCFIAMRQLQRATTSSHISVIVCIRGATRRPEAKFRWQRCTPVGCSGGFTQHQHNTKPKQRWSDFVYFCTKTAIFELQSPIFGQLVLELGLGNLGPSEGRTVRDSRRLQAWARQITSWIFSQGMCLEHHCWIR